MKFEFSHLVTPTIVVALTGGTVEVDTHAEKTTLVEVTGGDAEGVTVEKRTNTVLVHAKRHRRFGQDVRVRIVAPDDSNLIAKLGVSGIATSGVLGSVRISSAKGDVSIGEVKGSTVVKSGFGKVTLGGSEGATTVMTGFGDVDVRRYANGNLTIKTGSGNVTVGVPDLVPVLADISTAGEIRSERAPAGEAKRGQNHVRLTVRTGHGDVVLRQAG